MGKKKKKYIIYASPASHYLQISLPIKSYNLQIGPLRDPITQRRKYYKLILHCYKRQRDFSRMNNWNISAGNENFSFTRLRKDIKYYKNIPGRPIWINVRTKFPTGITSIW